MSFLDSMKAKLGLEDRNRFRDDDYYEDEPVDEYDEFDDDYDAYDDAGSSADLYAFDSDSSYSGRTGGVKVVPRSGSGSYSDPSFRDDTFGGGSSLSDWRNSRGRACASDTQPEFMSHRGSDSYRQSSSSRQGSAELFGTDSPRTAQQRSQVKVITPSSYADAEGVTSSFKVGTNVALQLTSVRPELAKRILDFSFGVVSALGGTVEKVGEKVFLLSHSTTGITADETRQLREAGIIK